MLEKRGSTTKLEDWRMTQHDPAGTVEMKPPEVLTSLSIVSRLTIVSREAKKK